MAFNLGQFRQNSTTNYVTPLTYSFIDIETKAGLSETIIFIDKAIQLSGSNVLESDKNYYLNFSVYRSISTSQKIKVYLKNSNAMEDNVQKLYTYTIAQGLDSIAVPIELIISPNGLYNQIVFELQRTSDDYSDKNSDGTYGKKLNIEISNLDNIHNILTDIGHSPLVKIGVQGPQGLLMCINGEEIRVGRSGIYEITNGYKINFIGFIKSAPYTPGGTDYFIMDYQY